MFASLSDNLNKVFNKLKGRGLLSEEDISTAMREIRITLLEADVALTVVKDFIAQVKEKALGAELIKNIRPGHLVVKIVSDELKAILTSEEQGLNLTSQPPVVIMMVGLQGSGKTTSSAKLALYLNKKLKKKVMLASLDTYRPAAQQQLEILAKQIDVVSLNIVEDEKPIFIAKRALKQAEINGSDILILDTAGRLHSDDMLIKELIEVKSFTNPNEVLLVADSMTGQDAVNIAREFNDKVGITGVILTRVDGDARGGAALSMRKIANKPIKFMGTGEKNSEFEEFHAERIASRILGMGDVVSLVEQASEIIDKEESEKIAKKLQKGFFDMNDMLSQLKNIKKMGGIAKIMNFIPGMGKIKNMMKDASIDEKIFLRQEAIILSMTIKERRNPAIINASRKVRIAKGSGVSVQDVNKLMKQYITLVKMMKKFGKMSPGDISSMEKMLNV